MSIGKIILVLIGLMVIILLIWRLLSQRASLPCPVWLAWMVEMDNPFTKVNRAHEIINHLDVEPGMKILDAGCGPGRLTIPLALKTGSNGEVCAMDIQSGMLQKVQAKASALNIQNIRFLYAGLGEGKLESNYYDRAVLVTVLGEIPDQKKALKEIFNALKPGGILSITEIIFDPHFQSQGAVRQLTKEAGFVEKNVFGNRIVYTMNFIRPRGDSNPCY